MPLQRRLLHAMLLLLGCAALAGASTVFLSGRDFLARVTSTLVVGAVAIGLSIPASRGLDGERTRAVGLFALAAILGGFCLGLAAIWADLFGGLINSFDWPLAMTTLAYTATAAPAVAFFALSRRPAGAIAGCVGLAFAAAVFLFWTSAVWIGSGQLWSLEEKLAKSAGLLAAAMVPICASLVGVRDDGNKWRWIGVAAGTAGLVMAMAGLWLERRGNAMWPQNCFVVAACAGGANVLLRAPLPAQQRWLVYATLAALGATGASASFASFATDGFSYRTASGLAERLLGAGGIVTVCGAFAVLLLVAFNKRRLVTESPALAGITGIALSCPRCGRSQTAAMGESRCDGCGLIFLIRVAEPRCATCNYALLDLSSKRCPECGEPIVAPAPEPAGTAT